MTGFVKLCVLCLMFIEINGRTFSNLERKRGRILGGEKADLHQFPYQVGGNILLTL